MRYVQPIALTSTFLAANSQLMFYAYTASIGVLLGEKILNYWAPTTYKVSNNVIGLTGVCATLFSSFTIPLVFNFIVSCAVVAIISPVSQKLFTEQEKVKKDHKEDLREPPQLPSSPFASFVRSASTNFDDFREGLGETVETIKVNIQEPLKFERAFMFAFVSPIALYVGTLFIPIPRYALPVVAYAFCFLKNGDFSSFGSNILEAFHPKLRDFFSREETPTQTAASTNI